MSYCSYVIICTPAEMSTGWGKFSWPGPRHTRIYTPNRISAHCFLLRLRTGETVQNPFLFPCRKKKRFLESKEKGAPKGVKWSQIGIRRPGFTPPLWTSTVHRRLRRWNREKPWFYPTFFRRLRRWASGRGDAAWDCRCCGVGGIGGGVVGIAAWNIHVLPPSQNKAGAADGSARLAFPI